jgi:glycosyltransferase involved in cell wall biosynthesis
MPAHSDHPPAHAAGPPLCLLVPTYNRAAKLAALLSRLDAEFAFSGCAGEIKVLVSDNASTDATAAVLTGASSRYAWLKVHRQAENVGPQANMEWLVCNAPEANYLWLLGDDDFPIEGGLRQVLDLLSEERPAWLFLPHLWLDDEGRRVNGSPVAPVLERYPTAGDMYRVWHHWLTFMSASVVRADGLRAAVDRTRVRNAYHPLLWFFAAGLHGPCVVAPECLVHGSADISWTDRQAEYMTLHYTSLFDDGLSAGLTVAEFGTSLDGLYANGYGRELWEKIGTDRLAAAVARFPHSAALRRFLWELGRTQGRRDVVPVLQSAVRAAGADRSARELLHAGEESFADGDAPGAARLFQQALEVDPVCTDAWNNLAVIAHGQAQPIAPRLIEHALFISPDDANSLVNRALIRHQAGDAAGAADDARRAAALDPGCAQAQQVLAVVG